MLCCNLAFQVTVLWLCDLTARQELNKQEITVWILNWWLIRHFFSINLRQMFEWIFMFAGISFTLKILAAIFYFSIWILLWKQKSRSTTTIKIDETTVGTVFTGFMRGVFCDFCSVCPGTLLQRNLMPSNLGLSYFMWSAILCNKCTPEVCDRCQEIMKLIFRICWIFRDWQKILTPI